MDYVLLGLIFVLSVFSYFCIKQDLIERKVSNKLSFSLFAFAFVFFIVMSGTLFWIDFIILFVSFLFAYFVYKKEFWGAADGKLFIGIMIILMSYGHSEMFLRWILNIFFFYSIVIVLMSFVGTTRKQKKSILKEMDYIDASLVILIIFFAMDILLMVYMIDESDVYGTIFFFFVLIFFVDKVRKYLRKHFKKMFHDVKLMVFAILAMWMFLYSGGIWFLLSFGFVFFIRVLVEFVTDLSGSIKKKNGETYHSPFSLYLFLTAIFTLITNKSFIEILVFAFS